VSDLSCILQARRSSARLQSELSTLPWKWIALALCLAALLGAAHHYMHPLTQRCQELNMHAKSQLADTKAYIQGPLYKKARAWEHSMRQSYHHKRCPHQCKDSLAVLAVFHTRAHKTCSLVEGAMKRLLQAQSEIFLKFTRVHGLKLVLHLLMKMPSIPMQLLPDSNTLSATVALTSGMTRRTCREDFLDGWFAIRQHVKGYWRSLFKVSSPPHCALCFSDT